MKGTRPTEIVVTNGRAKVTVALSFANKKRLSLTVYPDKRVVAKAPKRASTKELVAFVEQRTPWIFKQLEFIEQLPPPPPEKQFVDGELHPYMGRQIPLRVNFGFHNTVQLKDDTFLMTLRVANRDSAPKLMQKWYSETARTMLEKRFWRVYSRFERMGVKRPELRFRRMRSRWGSCCKTKKTILLNTELIKAPKECIDYVIIHELCHMIHPSHGQRFYSLLAKVSPNWRSLKNLLEQTDL